MKNQYFILLLLSLVLASCGKSPQPKAQQYPVQPNETSVSTASQSSETKSPVLSNQDGDSTPIDTKASRGKSYSPQLVNNFMGACIQNGSTETNCGCMLNTFEQNFSEPEYLKVEQQLSATGKFPQFLLQEISNNCSNSEIQPSIARSNQEAIDKDHISSLEKLEQLEDRRRMKESQSRMSEYYSARMADMLRESASRSSESARAYMSSVFDGRPKEGTEQSKYPCDYSTQRDSQGNYCGDRSAVVRPGGRF